MHNFKKKVLDYINLPPLERNCHGLSVIITQNQTKTTKHKNSKMTSNKFIMI